MPSALSLMAWYQRLSLPFVLLCALALAGGACLHFLGQPAMAQWLWLGSASLVLLFILAESVQALWRRQWGLDLIALVSLAGAVALHEYLAAAVIALMFASGRALESHAQQRAREEMSALLARQPRVAHRQDGERIQTVPLEQVVPGDRLLVRPGETVPVDGTLLCPAVIDEATLTGESLPVTYPQGAALASGCINAGETLTLLAVSTAEQGTFAHIVRLVQAAQRTRAPATRMADRYALLFVPLALGMAGLAWLFTGDPHRALAVAVVATPCPLILAVPVALVCAMSRCAQRGVLIKHGAALERLAQVDILFFDKTGTLTGGKASLKAMSVAPSRQADQVLSLAATLEQMSVHAIGQAVVSAAVERGLQLGIPENVREQPGAGLSGNVQGLEVRVGTADYVLAAASMPPWAVRLGERVGYEGAAGVYIGVDGQLAGVLHMADEVRLETPRALRLLRACGAQRIVMLTGDRRDVATTIGQSLGVDEVMPEQSPASKLEAITAARHHGVTMMVGDGVNDAPALAAADIGVAMGARGAAAAAESAQVVLLVDRLDRLAFAVRVAQQTRAIALQSVLVGMGLSVMAMGVAAFGYLPPVAGALLQEMIDVVVILNALRVLRVERGSATGQITAEELRKLQDEHARLVPVLDRLLALADGAGTLPAAALREELASLSQLLQTTILPHELGDDARLYPRLTHLIGGLDPLAPMSNAHREIHRLCRQVERLSAQAADLEADTAMTQEIRRTIYALHAILSLHFAQEEEIYHGLAS